VNPEIAPMPQMPQNFIGNPSEIHMQRGPVFDDLGDVTGNAFGNRVGGLVGVFDKRSLDANKAIDAIDVQKRIAEGARHEGVDFGDDGLGVAQDAHGDIDRDAETDEAVRIRGRDLHESHVGLDAPIRGQMRNLGERDRHIFRLPAMHQRAHVGADEEAAMAVGGRPFDPERLQARGQEMEQLHVGRGRHPALKRLHHGERGCASGSDEDAVAGLDHLDRGRGRHQLIQDQLER
jgi:hypothetical protein